MSRYSVGGDSEGVFQPGSHGQVLRNNLGITDPLKMGVVEAEALDAAIKWSFDEFETTTQFSITHLRQMHEYWLGDVYEFAGQFRTVNISKGGILFAPVEHFEISSADFNEKLLRNTPCCPDESVASKIALIHGELILLHPFREGNGRLARWLADLMALQAGLGQLDWGFNDQDDECREIYFQALRQAFSNDFTLLTSLVENAIDSALF